MLWRPSWETEATFWLTRRSRRKPERERWERGNLNKIVGVPWRKNEDDPEMDGCRDDGQITRRRKFGRIRTHCEFWMHVVAQENGTTVTQRERKECLDRAAERRAKRTRTTSKRDQKVQGETKE